MNTAAARTFLISLMGTEPVAVFFYGLFMDESLLASKEIKPSSVAIGHVDGYALCIGTRATLLPDESNRAHGVLMTIGADDAKALYSDESVADYIAEPVSVVLSDGTLKPAVCYNLPESKLRGTNAEYAKALLALARRLGLPGDYLVQIEKQATCESGG